MSHILENGLKKQKSLKNIFTILFFILLYFVMLDEAADDFIITASSKIFSKQNGFLVVLLLILQMIFSPLQAGFSDFYCRKKSLLISLFTTVVSLILFKFSISFGFALLIIAIIIKGVLGNTLPIAWAAIADVTPKDNPRNIRFALALSIFGMAVGAWGILLLISFIKISILFIFMILVFIVAIFFGMFFFQDNEDSTRKAPTEKKFFFSLLKSEVIGIYDLIKRPVIIIGLISFLFSEISFYQIFFRVEVLSSYPSLIPLPLAVGIGYTIGTAYLRTMKCTDEKACSIGIVTAISSITIIFLCYVFGFENKYMFVFAFSVYSFGFSVFTPSLFSFISQKSNAHAQGKIYGVIESFDSFASIITFFLVFSFAEISSANIFLISAILILFSYISLRITFRKVHI